MNAKMNRSRYPLTVWAPSRSERIAGALADGAAIVAGVAFILFSALAIHATLLGGLK